MYIKTRVGVFFLYLGVEEKFGKQAQIPTVGLGESSVDLVNSYLIVVVVGRVDVQLNARRRAQFAFAYVPAQSSVTFKRLKGFMNHDQTSSDKR